MLSDDGPLWATTRRRIRRYGFEPQAYAFGGRYWDSELMSLRL